MEITAETVLHDIRDCLHKGANSRKSPMHTPVVGTADGDLRVMVLREYDPGTCTLRFHTDARSPKVAAIDSSSQVFVLAYDPAAKVQIRMRGIGRVERSSDLAESAWQASTSFAKRCYLAEAAPSSQSDAPVSGLPEWAEGITPTNQQVEPGRKNFAVILIEVREFDWLYLANNGHRRAQIIVGADGEQTVNWLVP